MAHIYIYRSEPQMPKEKRTWSKYMLNGWADTKRNIFFLFCFPAKHAQEMYLSIASLGYKWEQN